MKKYYLDIEVNCTLNVKCLIQIRKDNANFGQAMIKKILKTLYHVYYNGSNYSIKKSVLKYNIHGQVCADIQDIKQIK